MLKFGITSQYSEFRIFCPLYFAAVFVFSSVPACDKSLACSFLFICSSSFYGGGKNSKRKTTASISLSSLYSTYESQQEKVLLWVLKKFFLPGFFVLFFSNLSKTWAQLSFTVKYHIVVECKTASVGEFGLLLCCLPATHISGTIHSTLLSFSLPLWKANGVAILFWNVICRITAANG